MFEAMATLCKGAVACPDTLYRLMILFDVNAYSKSRDSSKASLEIASVIAYSASILRPEEDMDMPHLKVPRKIWKEAYWILLMQNDYIKTIYRRTIPLALGTATRTNSRQISRT